MNAQCAVGQISKTTTLHVLPVLLFQKHARAKVINAKNINSTLQYENVDPATSSLGSDTRALPKWIPSTICSFLTVSVLTSYTPM